VQAAITPGHHGRRCCRPENGISTSYFQLSTTGDGNVTVTLNNFCKLQEMGPDDEDDILSCVTFLLPMLCMRRN
jgi:hypothetical protein